MQTLSEKSAVELRRRLEEGQYKSGEFLSQRKVAQEIGVSAIVVRESFRILEKEGLLEIVPKWGSRVVSFDPERFKGQFILREAIEGMAARLVAEKITAQEVELLYSLADKLDRMFQGEGVDPKELTREHYEFHLTIARLSGCKEILETLDRVKVQQVFFLLSRVVDYKTHVTPPGWHRQLVDVLAGGNPDEAEKVMRVHVRKGLSDTLDSLGK